MGLLIRCMWTKRAGERGVPAQGGRMCRGGQSWGCRHDAHATGRTEDIHCYRCNVRLGCSVCVPRLPEAICLQCNNYGHKYGIQKHGNIVPNSRMPRVRTDAGWQRWQVSTDLIMDTVRAALP